MVDSRDRQSVGLHLERNARPHDLKSFALFTKTWYGSLAYHFQAAHQNQFTSKTEAFFHFSPRDLYHAIISSILIQLRICYNKLIIWHLTLTLTRTVGRQ